MSSHTDCSGSICGIWSLRLGAEPANGIGNIGTSLGRQAVAGKGCPTCVGRHVGQHGCTPTVSLSGGTNMHEVWGQLLLSYPEASALHCLPGPGATEAVSKGLGQGYLDHKWRRATEDEGEIPKLGFLLPSLIWLFHQWCSIPFPLPFLHAEPQLYLFSPSAVDPKSLSFTQ